MQVQRKFIMVLTLLFIGFVLILFCAWDLRTSESGILSVEAEEGRYVIVGLDGEKICFLNQVDGYGISLPESMKVAESTSADIRMVLEDEHVRIEIYKQPLAEKEISADTYISYSNGFLQNTDDHRLELRKKLKVNGYNAAVTQWSRDKLKNVSDDRNHYACIDIISGEFVYTFFIKSAEPFRSTKDYLKFVEDFYTFDPTVAPKSMKFQQTENTFWDDETKAFYDKYFLEEGPLNWGIFKHSAPADMGDLKAIEDKLDHEFEFLLVYKHIQKAYPTGYAKDTLESAYDNGRTVELTLQTAPQEDGEGNMVYDVLDGKYDAFLYSFARETAQFGHPVLFRFCNEMNGDWCPYSGYNTSRDAELYKACYKYIYEIFREVEADNVIWIWNPNEKSFPDFNWNNEILYYPGDEYVDVVGLTGYNTGTYYSGETWRGFTEIYDPLYEKAVRLSDKPLMITEFSSSSVGGDKAEWVEDMFLNLHRYPRIRMAVWWDGCDWDAQGNIARPYFIDESEELTQVFKKYLKGYDAL